MTQNKKSRKGLVIVLILISIVIMLAPLLLRKGAEFGGSDDAGSVAVEEITDGYEPWFTPILETLIGGELPGEIESLFFCIQTGIGVGIIAYCFGYLVARKKYAPDEAGVLEPQGGGAAGKRSKSKTSAGAA